MDSRTIPILIGTFALAGIVGCRAPATVEAVPIDGRAIAEALERSAAWALVTDRLEDRYGCPDVVPSGWAQRFGTELGGDTEAEAAFQTLSCPNHRVTISGVRLVGDGDFAVSAVVSTPWDAEVTEDRLLLVSADGALHDVLLDEVRADLDSAAARLAASASEAESRTEGLAVAALTPEQIQLATTACQRIAGVGAASCPPGGCNGCECASDANQCAGYLLNQVLVQSNVFWAQQCMTLRGALPSALPRPTGPGRFYCSDGPARENCVDDAALVVMRADGSTHECENPAAYDRDILATSSVASLNDAVVDLSSSLDEEQQAMQDLASLVGTISAFVPYVGLLGELGETATTVWGHIGDAVGLAEEMSSLMGVERSNFERFSEAYLSEDWGLAGAQYYCWRHRREAYTSTDEATTIRPPRCAPGGRNEAVPLLRCGLDPDVVYNEILRSSGVHVDYRALDSVEGIAAFDAYCVDYGGSILDDHGSSILRYDGDWYVQPFDEDYYSGHMLESRPFFCCEADVRVSWPAYDDDWIFMNASDEFRWAHSVPSTWDGFGCGYFTGAAATGDPMGVDIRTGTSPWGEACTWSPYTTPPDDTTPPDIAVAGSDLLSLPVGTWFQ